MSRLRCLPALSLLLALGACWSGSPRKESPPAELSPVRETSTSEAVLPFDTVEEGSEAPAMQPTVEMPELPADSAELESTGQADYVFVFLRMGSGNAGQSGGDVQSLQTRHLANIQRLAADHQLLVAGPFRDGSPDSALRGIFVLDVADVELARDLVTSDPAVAAGTLSPIYLRWRATTNLRQILELELAERSRRLAENPNSVPPFDMHNYVLGEATAGAGAEDALTNLREEGRLLFFGRVQDNPPGRVIFLLDVEDTDEAREMLEPASGVLSHVTLHPWLGTTRLTKLAELD